MTMERDSLVARLRAEEARMQRLWDACAEFHAKHKGTPAAFDFNSLKHAIGGRDPVLEEAAAALSRHEQVVPPAPERPTSDAWKLVPVEPTEAMLDEADRAHPLPFHYVTNIYRAMLASAPASPAIGIQAVTCATEGCEQPATCRFERKGVGSVYCGECFGRIIEAVDRASDTAPSPKGVSDGAWEALEAVKSDIRTLDALPPSIQSQQNIRIINAFDRALAALSQEPVPATAEERAASKEGA